jgi:hypothetical protein
MQSDAWPFPALPKNWNRHRIYFKTRRMAEAASQAPKLPYRFAAGVKGWRAADSHSLWGLLHWNQALRI